MGLAQAGPGIDQRSFERISRIVYQQSGISLKWDKATLLVGRLSKRLRKLGLSDFKQYADLLEKGNDASELTVLLDAVSTNVTYFFREPDHFEFAYELMRGWLGQGQTRFRLWCAACSTGEEPYTIGMTLAPLLRPGIDYRLLATDISTEAVAKAIRGVYPSKAVEGIPKALLQRAFMPAVTGGGAEFAVDPVLKQLILFRQFNLVDFPYRLSGPLDIIFCRNVMIYFDQPTRQQVVNEFYRLLKPGGYLIVSHSESLTGLDIHFRSPKPSIYVKD